MRRLPLVTLLLALAACAGPPVAHRAPDSAPGAEPWSADCAAQKASCEVLG